MREVFQLDTWSQRVVRAFAGALVAALGGSLLVSLPAVGAQASDQGALAFVSDRDGDAEIFTVRPDASGLQQLTFNQAWDTDPTWSPDGTRIAFSSDRDGDDDIYIMSRDGMGVTNITNSGVGRDTQPDWSPDGSRLAFVRDDVIRLVGAYGGSTTVLAEGRSPSWSPDGSKIAFARPGPQNTDIYVIDASGGPATQLTSGLEADAPEWSPDGGRIAFEARSSDLAASRIHVMRSDGTMRAELPGDEESEDFSPTWSVDGSSLAFTNIALDAEITVTAADGSGRRVVASHVAYDFLPSWSPCTTNCPGPTPSQSNGTPTGSPSTSPSTSPSEDPADPKDPTRMTFDSSTSRRFVKAAGSVRPPHPGRHVQIVLAGRKNGRWARLAIQAPVMDTYGNFVTRFRNPPNKRRCRLIARFDGDHDHLASRKVRRFRC